MKKLCEWWYKKEPAKKLQIDETLSPMLQRTEIWMIVGFMQYCAATKFEWAEAHWYMDENLDVQLESLLSRHRIRYLIKPIIYRDTTPFQEHLYKELHDTLVRNAIKVAHYMLLHHQWLRPHLPWKTRRCQIISLCIAVSEVTEEISFRFYYRDERAMTILHDSVFCGYRDGGLMLDLASQ